MKVFIDIGGNNGQTLQEVVKKKYNFDKIFCIEPSRKCFEKLDNIAANDNRIQICKFGLGLKNSEVELFEPGLMSASIFNTNEDASNIKTIESEKIKIINASEWVKENLSESDINVVKINVEGSEIEILRSWLDSNSIKTFYSIVIMFDIRNFKNLRHLEKEIREDLRKTNCFNYCDADDIIRGKNHSIRINNWLSTFGLESKINSKEKLIKKYGATLKKYSEKKGQFYQFEYFLKELILYKFLPEYLKKPFKLLKKIIGKNKETQTKL